MTRLAFCVALCLSSLSLIGCGPAAQHDHHGHDHGGEKHAHPETFAAAVTELAELRDKVREAFAKKETQQADELVHDVGHLLEEVGELAEKEKLPPADVLAIKSVVSELAGHFEEVDKQLHGEKGKSYDEVAKAVDAAIAKLTERVKK